MIIPVKNNHFAAPVGSKLKNRVIVQLYFVNMDCRLVKLSHQVLNSAADIIQVAEPSAGTRLSMMPWSGVSKLQYNFWLWWRVKLPDKDFGQDRQILILYQI